MKPFFVLITLTISFYVINISPLFGVVITLNGQIIDKHDKEVTDYCIGLNINGIDLDACITGDLKQGLSYEQTSTEYDMSTINIGLDIQASGFKSYSLRFPNPALTIKQDTVFINIGKVKLEYNDFGIAGTPRKGITDDGEFIFEIIFYNNTKSLIIIDKIIIEAEYPSNGWECLESTYSNIKIQQTLTYKKSSSEEFTGTFNESLGDNQGHSWLLEGSLNKNDCNNSGNLLLMLNTSVNLSDKTYPKLFIYFPEQLNIQQEDFNDYKKLDEFKSIKFTIIPLDHEEWKVWRKVSL